MKKSFLIVAIFALSISAIAEDIVFYADTTYGPSDTVVHYDMDREQEDNKEETNIPNNDIYVQTKDDTKSH